VIMALMIAPHFPPFSFLVPTSYLALCEDRPGTLPLRPPLRNAYAIALTKPYVMTERCVMTEPYVIT